MIAKLTTALIAALLFTASLGAVTVNFEGYLLSRPGAVFATTMDSDPRQYIANCTERYDVTNIPSIATGEFVAISSIADAAAAILLGKMMALGVTPAQMTELAHATWSIRDASTPLVGNSAQLSADALAEATALGGDYSSLARFSVFLNDDKGGQDFVAADTPEPAALALTGAGLVLLGWGRRRKASA